MACNGCRNGTGDCGCGASAVALSGVVTGVSGPVSGIAVQYSVNCRSLSTVTDADGNYAFLAPVGSFITVSPAALAGVTAAPPSYSMMACVDRTDLDFALTSVTPTMFTVRGAVSGLPVVSGIPVNYTVNGLAASTTTDANGAYAITAASGAAIVITPPAVAGFNVTPPSYTIASLSGDMSAQNFAYSPSATNFTVSGAIAGLPVVSGIPVNYTVNGTALSTVTNASGAYAITAAAGAAIVITPTAVTGFNVTPANYVIASLSGNMIDQDFSYAPTPLPFTVSGTVSGLPVVSGVAVNYTVNNGPLLSTTTDASGAYAFTAAANSVIAITPSAVAGFDVAPGNYFIGSLSGDAPGQDFVYSQTAATRTITGSLTGPSGAIPNAAFGYTVNGLSYPATTNASGNYTITVPNGSNVVIQPPSLDNYSVAPLNHVINGISQNMSGVNFAYSLLPNLALVSGFVTGLQSNVNVPVLFTINGQGFSTATNAAGIYNVVAPLGSNVTVIPVQQAGFTVSPPSYMINNAQGNTLNQSFVYTGEA